MKKANNPVDHEYPHVNLIGLIPSIPYIIIAILSGLAYIYEAISNAGSNSFSHSLLIVIPLVSLGVSLLAVISDIPLIICVRDAYRITPIAREKLFKISTIIHVIIVTLPIVLLHNSPILVLILLALVIYAVWSLNKVHNIIAKRLVSKTK